MITDFQMDYVQQNGLPRIGRMVSTDTLSTVATAGYVNAYIANANIALELTDFIAVSASNGNHWFYPTFSGPANTGTVTLVSI